MLIAVDIGNTNLKTLAVLPNGDASHRSWNIPPDIGNIDDFISQRLLRIETLTGTVDLRANAYPKPITWRIIQTGRLDWKVLKTAILQVRPKDKFKQITHKQIPLKMDVDFPAKVGIDRLLAAFAAMYNYGNSPMLVVDAGTAITVDVVQNGTFRGGAILPGLACLSQVYPQISKKLPKVAIPQFSDADKVKLPTYPGKNTEDAILNGLYWGTVGAIGQFYDWVLSQTGELGLILTGGDAEYLLRGLNTVLPSESIEYCETLVVEGILRLPEARTARP
ncbi:MAG: type III pantothenate kinase [Planctomycetaceae bacterium]|nr:type III pantothenate kinase [Planctomycetaceae bacterium]